MRNTHSGTGKAIIERYAKHIGGLFADSGYYLRQRSGSGGLLHRKPKDRIQWEKIGGSLVYFLNVHIGPVDEACLNLEGVCCFLGDNIWTHE